MRLRHRALLCVAGLLTAAFWQAAPAAAADRGFAWYTSAATGIALWPGGVDVWIVPGKHTAIDVHQTKFVLSQLREYGVDIHYRGVNALPPPLPGTLIVSEPRRCPSGVAGEGGGLMLRVLGDGMLVITQSSVQICPAGYREYRGYRHQLYLHEFGHAVGLGHVGRYRGRLQVMSPVALALTHYRAGDVHGLRALVANTQQVAAAGLTSG